MPKGYQSVTPYLSVRGAADAIDFYKQAFGARERMRMPGPNGKLGHAEIEINGHCVMLSDEHPEMGHVGPQTLKGTSVSIHVYVPDVDKLAERAGKAGAKIMRGPEDQFYGDRIVSLEDPFGHRWHFATHVRDVSMKEMKKVAAEWAAKAEQGGASGS
ncbi:MAG: VOC family protein [Betaproteobacteria bacterium]|nr:VOC family protein [Betaproteobacteria bacterium]